VSPLLLTFSHSLLFLSRVHGRFSNWARVCIRNSGMLFHFLCLIRIVINFLTIRSKSPVNLWYYLILLRSKLDRQLTTYVSTTNIYISSFFLCLLLFHLFFFFFFLSLSMLVRQQQWQSDDTAAPVDWQTNVSSTFINQCS